MTRRRAGLVVAVVIALALIGVGVWRRQQLMDERDDARAARTETLARYSLAQIELANTIAQAGAIETSNVELRRQTDDLQKIADGVATEIAAVSKERMTPSSRPTPRTARSGRCAPASTASTARSTR